MIQESIIYSQVGSTLLCSGTINKKLGFTSVCLGQPSLVGQNYLLDQNFV